MKKTQKDREELRKKGLNDYCVIPKYFFVFFKKKKGRNNQS